MSTGPRDPLYIVKSSGIHNRGVFAARNIFKGDRIIEYRGEKISKAESDRRARAHFDESLRTGNGAVYLFSLNKRHDLDGSMEWNLARLINHSCDPNCEAQIVRGHIWIVARRRIKTGDELSFDYGFDLNCWQDHPCRCGTGKCVGYIVGRHHWRKLRKNDRRTGSLHRGNLCRTRGGQPPPSREAARSRGNPPAFPLRDHSSLRNPRRTLMQRQ